MLFQRLSHGGEHITVLEQRHTVSTEPVLHTNVSERLASTITELRALHEPLLCREVDPSVLSNFRDAIESRMQHRLGGTAIGECLALRRSSYRSGFLFDAERVRAAYRLCRSLHDDVYREDIDFQKGRGTELYGAAKTLGEELKIRL
jgi:hypothetical protein